MVHEQKPVIKIKNPMLTPTANATLKKGAESRKASDKNNSKNTKKTVVPSNTAPLKLKISKNKDAEVSSERPPSNLKLFLSNGRIVR